MRSLVILFIFILALLGQDQTLSIQGVLRQPSGKAVNDGNYQITFNFYNDATGGSLVSSKQESVDVKDGLYTANVDIAGIPFNEQYWIGVQIGTDAELSPRAKLTAAPYALALRGLNNEFPSTGTVVVGDSLRVEGSIKVLGSFETNGDVQLNSNLSVTNNVSITGNLTSNGLISANDSLHVTGNFNVNNGNIKINGSSALEHSGDTLSINRKNNFQQVGINSPLSIMGESKFRILWGTVNSNGSFHNNGSGFTVTVNGDNSYNVLFNQSFSSPPTVMITPYLQNGDGITGETYNVTTNHAHIGLTIHDGGRVVANGFNIIIIGF